MTESTTSADESVLDRVVWESLTGAHSRFAELHGRAGRYRDDIAPFCSPADINDPAAWADLAALAGPAAEVLVAAPGVTPPPRWEGTMSMLGVQMVDAGMPAVPDEEAVELGPADVPQVLDLVERTRPGPFRPHTTEMGRYLGIRREGELVAMAGERLRPPGYTEISAVCTDPAFRGQGLAARLMQAVAAGIRARGETPFLHAAGSNTGAIRLYEKLGFVVRSEITFAIFRTPAAPAEDTP